jgi:pimeloyl-ACP methyl ester carboxylesterase
MHRGAAAVSRAGMSSADSVALTVFRRLKFEYAIRGAPPSGWDSALAAARRASWFAQTGDGLPNKRFWSNNGMYDPAPALRDLRIPVLAVFGARDSNKDVAGNVEQMQAIFSASANRDAKVISVANANHGLFITATGLPIERELPALTTLAPEYLELIAGFIRQYVLR